MTLSSDDTGASVTGRAYPPLSSREVNVRLAVGTNTIWLVDEHDQIITRARLDEVKVEPRVGQAERRVVFPDKTLFLTSQHSALEGLLGQSHGATLHGLERFHPRLILVAIACLFGAFATWKYGLTLLVSLAVWMTPTPLIEAIDDGVMQAVDRFMAEPSDLPQDRQDEVQQSFDRVLTALGPDADAHDYQLEFRNLPGMGPNAFALPNGTIVLTDDLINIASEDAIAGVIGHEIGHVAEQHGLHQVYRSVGGFVLIAMLAGDTGPMLEEILLEGNVILSLSYSRTHELAADRFGADLAYKAGYDPNGLIEFFDLVEDEFGPQENDWFSTHPGFQDRKDHLHEMVEGH